MKTMVTLDTLRQEKKADILRLAAVHGCSNVRVFGSVATGENRPESRGPVAVLSLSRDCKSAIDPPRSPRFCRKNQGRTPASADHSPRSVSNAANRG